MSFANFGNDLYSGKRSIPVVAQRSRFYLISLIVIAIAVGGLVWKGLNLGLEFRGGSEFRVALSAEPSGYENAARDAVTSTGAEGTINVTLLGTNTVRVQTERLDQDASAQARTALAETFNVPEADVSATFIGPSWGASVSQKALPGADHLPAPDGSGHGGLLPYLEDGLGGVARPGPRHDHHPGCL